MSTSELKQQDTINKRKLLLRSDAVVGDDDNKVKSASISHYDSFKNRSTSTSQSKGIILDSTYTDMMGVDVLPFIENTLHKNAKDREFLLCLEQEVKELIADENRSFHFFPPMSSYNRMLVHRVAAFFGLIHNVDRSGQQVVVTKNKGQTRIPDIQFSSLIKHSNFNEKYPSFGGGRRNVQSFDEATLSAIGRPFQSFNRPFRSRFHTTTGENTGELNRGRRAHSFEMGDWYGANLQQHQQITYRQQSTNLEYMTGEGMSSNCSSNASSSAIPGHMQAIHLPMYPPGQYIPILSNEAALLSPSNASVYSEPVPPSYPQSFYKPVGDTETQPSEKDEEPNAEQQQSSHPHIPSLFSVQPIPMQMYSANQYPYVTQYQGYYQQYQTQPSQFVSLGNATNQFTAPICYQSYYPIYQQSHQPKPIIQPHPLLEENKTRQLEANMSSMQINSGLETIQQTVHQINEEVDHEGEVNEQHPAEGVQNNGQLHNTVPPDNGRAMSSDTGKTSNNQTQ